jgi:hypothetical protein
MSLEGNLIAYAALLAWPIVAAILYSYLSAVQATIWTVLGAQLLLPANIQMKAPMLPAVDKVSVAAAPVLIFFLFCARARDKNVPSTNLSKVLLAGLIVVPIITSLNNSDSLFIGRFFPGIGLYDAVSYILPKVILVLPYILARRFLWDPSAVERILFATVLAGLLYSPLMLFEVRFSPQLNVWLYGYFAHDFLQQIREGGFRPVVFMGHGLLVALFAATSVIAAAALWRTRQRIAYAPPMAITMYLMGVLLLCKTLGALILAAVAAPLARFATPRLQTRIAVVLVIITMGYPVFRSFDLVPTSSMLTLASMVSEEREASLQTRFEQEEMLLERASQRLWFGWGGYGRNRVYHPEYGYDMSITDGQWIITVGTVGLLGFIAEFGMLTLPVFRAAVALKYIKPPHERVHIAALTLILAVSAIDQLPNASLSPWTWLIAGVLLGRADAVLKQRAGQGAVKATMYQAPSSVRGPYIGTH